MLENPVKPSLKPPFKWTGGKNRMWDQYVPHFFPDNIDTFVDMFCGAGSVSLWIAENYPSTKIVLNDFNSELIDLYRVMRDSYSSFEKEYLDVVQKHISLPFPRTEKSFASKEEYKEWSKDWENNNPRKIHYYELRDRYAFDYESIPTERLMAELYFMLRVNFNGMWKAYKKMNLRYSTPPGTLMQKDSFFNIEETRKFHQFLQRCELRNVDFGDLTGYEGPNTYYYADPPYRDSIVDYQGGFTEDDQKRLVTFLKDCSAQDCFIAESNKEIGDGFWNTHFGEDYNIHVVDAKYTAGRGKVTHDVKEVLITNF